jgi:predicted membrane metal-binding protein
MRPNALTRALARRRRSRLLRCREIRRRRCSFFTTAAGSRIADDAPACNPSLNLMNELASPRGSAPLVPVPGQAGDPTHVRTARGRKGLDTRAPQPRPRIYNIQSDGRAGAAQVAAYVRCPSSRPRPRPGEVNYQKIASFHAGVHPQLITTTQDSTQPRFSLTLRLSYYYLLCSFIHSLFHHHVTA